MRAKDMQQSIEKHMGGKYIKGLTRQIEPGMSSSNQPSQYLNIDRP